MDHDVYIESDKIVEVAKPLFYGFIALTAFTMSVSPAYAGTLLGVAVMALISFVSAGFADAMEDQWSEFLNSIAVLTLLVSVLAASYVGVSLSLLG